MATKTPLMLRIEKEKGILLEKLIPQLYEEFGSLDATAKELGTNYNTLYGWMLRLSITIKKTAQVG